MGLFHRGKKNNDDEPDSVQTLMEIMQKNHEAYTTHCHSPFVDV